MSSILKKRELEQYFTPDAISSLLVSSWDAPISNALDLSMGHGDLLAAVKNKFKNVHCVGVDIDSDCILATSQKINDATLIHLDALNLPALHKSLSSLGPFDGIIGNPPFTSIPNNAGFKQIVLEQLNLNAKQRVSIRAEVIFLAQSIANAKKGSIISMILPLSFMKGASHKLLREELLKSHRVVNVTKLPPNVFLGTEVSTYAITFKAREGVTTSLELHEVNISGDYIRSIKVTAKEAATSMDAEYNEWQKSAASKLPKLGDFSATVNMGNIRQNISKEKGIEAFHTTDFSQCTEGSITFNGWNKELIDTRGLITAEAGNILIPRIGRNLNKTALVTDGAAPITEAVIKISVPKKDQSRVLHALQNPIVNEWREIYSSGSCTKMIPVRSILEMPIPN